MATENAKYNTRIQLKHDTEANWLKAINFIPKAGEMIIYDADDANPVRIKVGDGTTKVNDLPFQGSNVVIKTWTTADMLGLLSMSIDGVTYQFEEGMTWAQWVDSNYNTNGYKKGTYGTYSVIYSNDGTKIIVDLNAMSEMVLQGYEIDSNGSYGLSNSSGPVAPAQED